MKHRYTHRGITNNKNKYIVVISKRESDIHSLNVQWVGQGERYFFCQLEHDEKGRSDARALESYVYRLRAELSNVAHVEYVSFRNTTFLPEEDEEEEGDVWTEVQRNATLQRYKTYEMKVLS